MTCIIPIFVHSFLGMNRCVTQETQNGAPVQKIRETYVYFLQKVETRSGLQTISILALSIGQVLNHSSTLYNLCGPREQVGSGTTPLKNYGVSEWRCPTPTSFLCHTACVQSNEPTETRTYRKSHNPPSSKFRLYLYFFRKVHICHSDFSKNRENDKNQKHK